MAAKKKARAKRIMPRTLKKGERLKPGRLPRRSTAREVKPANLILEVLTNNKPLLIAAFDDWTARNIDQPTTAAERLRQDATFMEARMAGIPSPVGDEQADFLIAAVKKRLAS